MFKRKSDNNNIEDEPNFGTNPDNINKMAGGYVN